MTFLDAVAAVLRWLVESPADAITIVVATVASVSVLRKKMRERRSMLPSGVLLWSAACILQIHVVYDFIDPLLGGSNVTNLLYRILVTAALGCLEVMVIRATKGRGTPWESLGRVAISIGVLRRG